MIFDYINYAILLGIIFVLLYILYIGIKRLKGLEYDAERSKTETEDKS